MNRGTPDSVRSRQTCHGGLGFSLIELLVVIGIVTLLIGMVLPALSRAREQAKTTQCLSNLHQLELAAFIYAVDSHGSWPPAIGPTGVDWDFDYSNPTRGILPGLLWDGKTNMRVQQCPSYDGSSLGTNDPYTGYNYNTSYVGGGNGEFTPLSNAHPPAKIGMLRPAETIAMFGDGMCAGGTNKFMRAPILMAGTDIGDGVSVATRLAGTQGYRHLGKTNVCYLDGHAATVSTRFTNAAKDTRGNLVYGSAGAAPGCGFLSVDNSAYAGQ